MIYEQMNIHSRDHHLQKILDQSSEIGNIDRDEEIELILLAQIGHQPALDKLVISNARFCFIQARKYMGKGVELVDLFNEALSGVIEAVMRYDYSKAKTVTLLSYARMWVHQRIIDCIRATGSTVRLTKNMIKFCAIAENMSQERPGMTTDDIAESCEITTEWAALVLLFMHGQESLDAQIVEGKRKGDSLVDVVPCNAPDPVEYNSESDWLLRLMCEVLTDRERHVLIAMFWRNATFASVGKEIGYSRTMSHKIIVDATKKLRRAIERQDRESGFTRDDRLTMIEMEQVYV